MVYIMTYFYSCRRYQNSTHQLNQVNAKEVPKLRYDDNNVYNDDTQQAQSYIICIRTQTQT